MAVEKAPYIDYTDITSYPEDVSNGSEIPTFIVKTNNTVAATDITPNSIKRFVSYDMFKKHYSIPYNKDEYDALDNAIKNIDTIVTGFFKENSMYNDDGSYGLRIPYFYLIDVGNEPSLEHYIQALTASETKRNSTAVVFPDTEDVDFMKAVDMKLKTESKNGLLRIAYFGVSSQGNALKSANGTVYRPSFDHHGYVDVKNAYLKRVNTDTSVTLEFYETEDFSGTALTPNANYIYQDNFSEAYFKVENNAFVETTLDELEGYSKVVEGYKDNDVFYEDLDKTVEINPSESVIYIDKISEDSNAYMYSNNSFIEINVQVVNDAKLDETSPDYKFLVPSGKEIGGSEETFDEYCDRIASISETVKSSRVALIEKEDIGVTMARICSTPYYIEPGYLPYMSVPIDTFVKRSVDDRDALFATGLIFNEDDYTLATITPRICLATSTAWGVENHDMRSNDSLIHARRNVDEHVRNIFNIIAPQLKRNETSVTLRHVENQIDNYLNAELGKGTIVEYAFELKESSFNPYSLLVRGRITPVNSTLAIEFENTVGSPYAVASDYV